jgi:predicted RNase H-like HicB family nuclease
MRQRYHTIIRPQSNGGFIGWVEEVPGTITAGRTVDECRTNLRDSLSLMIETYRDEARAGLTPDCIMEPVEIDVEDARPLSRPQSV